MRIDAHQHFWKIDSGLNNWPTPDLTAIYRDFLPADLEKHLKQHHIEKTIVVQAAPTIEETEFLLDLAARHDSIGGVVGWLDLSSEQFPKQFELLRSQSEFVGLRPMLQSLPDDQWILQNDVKKNIHLLLDHDFPLDLLIYPKHLPYIVELLKEFPTLRAVIDHCAKPHIKGQQWERWADLMEEVSKYESVMCKLSGLVTEANHHFWSKKEFRPYILHVLNCFGTGRIMFGSDWPVCLLAGQYDEVVQIVEENLPKEMKTEEMELLFGGNAERFYKL